jgi:hypothetical protein
LRSSSHKSSKLNANLTLTLATVGGDLDAHNSDVKRKKIEFMPSFIIKQKKRGREEESL